MLTDLLTEDLVEHILLELCSRVTSSSDIEKSTLIQPQIESMKESVCELMVISGESYTAADDDLSAFSPCQMLDGFWTGTQRMDSHANDAPKDDEIGPISVVMNFDSPVDKATLKLLKTKPMPDSA